MVPCGKVRYAFALVKDNTSDDNYKYNIHGDIRLPRLLAGTESNKQSLFT